MMKINLNTTYVVPYTFGLVEWSLVAAIIVTAAAAFITL